MVYNEITIDIDAPPEKVWEVMTDIERWPGWTESVHDAAITSDGPFGPGSTAQLDLAGARPSTWIVTEFGEGRTFTWESRAPGVHSVASHTVEAREGGSRVTLWARNGGIVATLLTPYLIYVGKRNLKWESEGLKRRCEAKAA